MKFNSYKIKRTASIHFIDMQVIIADKYLYCFILGEYNYMNYASHTSGRYFLLCYVTMKVYFENVHATVPYIFTYLHFWVGEHILVCVDACMCRTMCTRVHVCGGCILASGIGHL